MLGVLFGCEFPALDVARVQLRVVLPLFGQVIQRKNRGDRADRHAGATIDALDGIDVELRYVIKVRTGVVVRRVLLRVDAVNGAGIDAGGVFCSDARFGNNEGYKPPPPISVHSTPQGSGVQAGGFISAALSGFERGTSVAGIFLGGLQHDRC